MKSLVQVSEHDAQKACAVTDFFKQRGIAQNRGWPYATFIIALAEGDPSRVEALFSELLQGVYTQDRESRLEFYYHWH
jgi:hypothetical protein